MAIKKTNKRGFTLIELMIVVAIVGVLAALAIYGVSRYLQTAKSAEATNALGRMGKDAAAAYDREIMAASVVTLGDSAEISHQMCDSAGATVPDNASKISGAKYQSSPTEWKAGSSSVGWECLKFSMQDPQYFMYNYQLTGTGSDVDDTFAATAQGDLDGDTVLSTFTLTGKLQAAGGEKVVTLATKIDEVDPEE